MSNLKLSIIIPVYNVEKYVEKCIRSCENQDIPKENYEVVIVNDGSLDGSLAIIKQLAKEYPNINVISQQNGGLSAARNTGIKHSKGEFLFFVDSDDWIKDNCLANIFSILKNENPDVLAVCAADIKREEQVRRFSYKGYNPTPGPEALKYVACACAPFQIVRKSLLVDNDIKFYEGIYHEDSEYTPRILYKAQKVIYMDDIIYYVYQNPNSITRTVNPKKVFDVLNVVAPNLYSYAIDNVEPRYKKYFYNIICSNINTVLGKNKGIAEEDRSKANKIFSEKKYLIKCFLKSSFIRYKLEGLLLVFFPSRLVNIYNFLTR